MQRKNLSIFGASFLDGFSFAGFFTPMLQPGAPTQVFANESFAIGDLQASADSGVTTLELEQARLTLVRAGFDVQLRRIRPTR